MNNSRGIFDSFPGQNSPSDPSVAIPGATPVSPFTGVPEPVTSPFAIAPDSANPFAAAAEISPPPSPFTVAPRADSPFAMASDVAEVHPLEPGKPARLPEKRKVEVPFEASDSKEGFGFEAPAPLRAAAPFPSSPFEVAPATSPFVAAAPAGPQTVSPFAIEQAPVKLAATPASPANSDWQQPSHAAGFSTGHMGESDSANIRQLELRAIFGVDREMGQDEILQRSRALPGIRHIARVSVQDIATIDSVKQVIANLGFGAGGLKLFAGSVPVEFIREGNVMLAIQTDGGFAPGVRETLMIVGRELGRF